MSYESVGDGEQSGARGQEEAGVEEGEAQADGAAGPMKPEPSLGEAVAEPEGHAQIR